jgi:dTDP-4-dehydrorhamnose reductase
MRIWVPGASGLLGSVLLQTLRGRGIACAGSSRHHVDIANLDSIIRFCREFGPFTHIVNCAAYTAVDRAESHRDEAHRSNALGPSLLGLFAAQANIRFIHLSTDYVFNGISASPYREEEQAAPTTVYGITKAEGERRLLALLPRACIVRTSWLFGKQGSHFVSSMLKKMTECSEVKVVADQRGRPTYVEDLAYALIKLLNQSGIYHVANAEETSWYQWAEAIRTECTSALRCERILPISTVEWNAPAPRPLYSVLSTEKFDRQFGALPSWRERLKDALA